MCLSSPGIIIFDSSSVVSEAFFLACCHITEAHDFLYGQDLFLTPGQPEEQDPSTGHYSACSESGYCLIYDDKGLIIQHSQQH